MAAQTKSITIRGHVFVVKADIRTIMCDAWLCPTDGGFNIEPWAREGLEVKSPRLTGYSWGGRRAIAYKHNAIPLIVLGNVYTTPTSGPEGIAARIDQLLPLIDEFVGVSVAHLARSQSDQPPRLALPLIGTGQGGLRGVKGHTLRPLLEKLDRVAAEAHVDFVLCTYDALAWSAVQAARAVQQWPLTTEEHELAENLAAESQAEGLVLFIGAGASRDVNLPDWRQLLERLSESRLNDLSGPERQSLSSLDPRDYATLIENDLGRPLLLSKLEEELGRSDLHIGLTHALLASLGAQQVVTTNYDNLFERASAYDGRTVEEAITVLPYGQVQQKRPWLLKLHGSLHHSAANDIVLTRSDYMRLRHQRGALYGIVQALLVTKHLLFVGYSLNDEDFHELADEIRTALEPRATEPKQLGTVLTIEESAWGRLWGDLFNVVNIGNGPPAIAARRLQIFLDRVAYLATPRHAYLLEPSFDGLLSDEEQQIATSLRKLERVVAGSDHPTAHVVSKALREFGATPGERPNRLVRRREVRLNEASEHELAEAVHSFNSRYGEMERVLWCLSTHCRAALLNNDDARVLEELVWTIKSWWGVQGVRTETKSAMARALLTLDWSPELLEPTDTPQLGGEEYATNQVATLVRQSMAMGVQRREYSLASKVLHWLLPWRIPVYDSFVRSSLGIPERWDHPEAYARIARELFAAARTVTAANPAWVGSLEPRSPLRAFDKCLWWFGGGN
ncbi:SIR2 family NAD-dependent protein deacylase, partial [Mycobacterium kyorinense]|uniref:SIR2 family NAD-dependent protein deacylase n=1 Tax=Mycobacterium kyorinense TaxID=487514 RepID=UPI000AE1ACCE